MSTSDDLQRAYQLIKAGNKEEATKLLIPIVRADNNNADAWWLLANAVPRADQSRSALKQVLRLRPDDKNAQRMMEHLSRTDPPAEQPVSRPAPPPPPAPPAAVTTFDDDPFGVEATAPSVYEDDPFADDVSAEETSNDDVWDDPFAPAEELEDVDPFADITTTLENAQRKRSSSRAEMTDDHELFMPPDRRSDPRRPRSGSSDRPASIDDDLVFDDDPFDPAKPEPPVRTASRSSGGAKSGKRSTSGTAKSSSGARSGGKSAGKRKSGDILIRDDFTGDPFAPGADIQARQTGFDRLLTIGLAIILIGAVGLLAVLLINNNNSQGGGSSVEATASSIVNQNATTSIQATQTAASEAGGVTVIGAGGELADLALTIAANPAGAGEVMSTLAAAPERLATVMAQATAVPALSNLFDSAQMGEMALTLAADPSQAGELAATMAANSIMSSDSPLAALAQILMAGGGGDEAFIATQMAQMMDMNGIMPDEGGFVISDPLALPSNVNERGDIEIGATVRRSVDTFIDDMWRLTGRPGDEIQIDLSSITGALDPQLYFYDVNGQLMAQNDDIDMTEGNMNSRIEVTLPVEGMYYIVVSAFGDGGEYELSVSRQ